MRLVSASKEAAYSLPQSLAHALVVATGIQPNHNSLFTPAYEYTHVYILWLTHTLRSDVYTCANGDHTCRGCDVIDA